ncbi:MAG TPA: right-handed parallel beta-helix repeat-containing protein [Pyrinomonadaceae bacterium]|nr:right-handed parallel beta-helix repeat-containing protein [Pyrinomonadaceae bacterium]
MSKFRFTIKVLAIATFMFATVSIAQAQASRTWVSGVGDDANPCSRTAPCKTWAGAISKTAACGEIDALDPGGFGAVTITKSITLDGTGQLASILASLTTGITINALSTDVITIRGISINGFCNGLRGMNILQAKTVNVEDCVIFRFAGPGILVNETSDLALNVRNTVIRDNTGAGIQTFTSSGTAKVRGTLDRVNLTGNLHGLHARSGSLITARNSVFSNNSSNGIFADAAATNASVVFSWANHVSNNGGIGARAGNAGNLGTSGIEIAQNQIDSNVGSGVLVSTNGLINTFSNNSIQGNTGGDGCTGCTPIGPGN